MKNTTYKILRDTPTIKAGTVGELDDSKSAYIFKTLDSRCGDLFERFRKHYVEATPDWFEPVIERFRDLNDSYFYCREQLTVGTTKDMYMHDQRMWECGNYFKTRGQAEEASKRIKKCLMDYHAEIGE